MFCEHFHVQKLFELLHHLFIGCFAYYQASQGFCNWVDPVSYLSIQLVDLVLAAFLLQRIVPFKYLTTIKAFDQAL